MLIDNASLIAVKFLIYFKTTGICEHPYPDIGVIDIILNISNIIGILFIVPIFYIQCGNIIYKTTTYARFGFKKGDASSNMTPEVSDFTLTKESNTSHLLKENSEFLKETSANLETQRSCFRCFGKKKSDQLSMSTII